MGASQQEWLHRSTLISKKLKGQILVDKKVGYSWETPPELPECFSTDSTVSSRASQAAEEQRVLGI